MYSYYKFRKYNVNLSIKILISIFLIGLIGNFIPFYLISWSEQYIKSNTAGLLLSVAPIFTLLISHFFTKDDKFSLRKFMSILIGFIGVIYIINFNTLINISSQQTGNLLPKFVIIIAALGYVISSILAYNIKNVNTVALTTFVTISAALISLPFMIIAEFTNPSSFEFNSFLSLIYLGLFPTAIAFVIRFYIISKAGPIFLSYVAYLIPGFAILWGYIFLKETINKDSFIGVILILFGVFLSQKFSAKNN